MGNYHIENEKERILRTKEDIKSTFRSKNIVRRFFKKSYLNENILYFRLKQFFEDWEDYRKTAPFTYTIIHFIDDEIEYNQKSINKAKQKDERRRKHTCQEFDRFLNEYRNFKTNALSLKPSKDLKEILENNSLINKINIIEEPLPEVGSTKHIILESILSMFYDNKHIYKVCEEKCDAKTRLFFLDYILKEFSFYKSLENPYQNDILAFLLNVTPNQINKKHKALSKKYHERKHKGSLEKFDEDEFTQIEENLQSLSELLKKINENINSELEDIKTIKKLKNF